MLRTYELLDFIKKYLRRIENALNHIGIKFIQKYCIEKMGSKSIQNELKLDKNKKLQEDKNDVIQIKSYRKITSLKHIKKQ